MNLLNVKKLNNVILVLIFFVIFSYYLSYPIVSAKEFILNLGLDSKLKIYYGFWGLFNDYIFKIFNFILGKFFTGIIIIQLIFAFQLSSIWSYLISKTLKELNLVVLIVFLNPFILDFFSLCTRDSIALGLLILIAKNSWSKIKFSISLILSFLIHKGIIPLIFVFTFIENKKNKSKYYFILMSFISIFISLIIFYLLRYTDIALYLPNSSYKEVLSFPRIGLVSENDISDLVNKAYNFYGDFNLKILIFGFIGQIISIFYRDKFQNELFSLSFAVFFVCAILSSIPNADRFIYHAVLISFPYLFYFSIGYLKNLLAKK